MCVHVTVRHNGRGLCGRRGLLLIVKAMGSQRIPTLFLLSVCYCGSLGVVFCYCVCTFSLGVTVFSV